MRNTVLLFSRSGDQLNARRGPKFSLRALVEVVSSSGRELPVVGVEDHGQVASFVQQRVVFVAQAVVHGQVRTDLPFVLRIADQ